jgi:hypothetical protein
MEEIIKKIRLKNIMSETEIRTYYYSKNLTELENIRSQYFKKINLQTKELKRPRDKEEIDYKKALIEKSEIVKNLF